jgi:DNA mismatch repair ATPase MutS
MTEHNLQYDLQTLKDLNLSPYHSEGKAIFELFTQSQTLGGQNCLQYQLKYPSTDAEWIRKRQDSIRYLQNHPIPFPFPLAELDHIEYYLKTDINPVSSGNRLGRWAQGMSYRLNDFGSHHFLQEGLKQLASIVQGLDQLIDHLIPKQLPGELKAIMNQLADTLQTQIGTELCAIRTNRMTLQQVYRLDQMVRQEFTGDIRKILNEIYHLDALQTLANQTRKLGWHLPEVMDGEQSFLQIAGLYHPQLENAVPNDFNLGDSKHLLFLTGPNMAGKTTFLKALGISVYLAQLGLPVPANRMRLTPFQTLITSIHTRDRLDKGYSFFFSEVQRVKDAANTLKKGSNVLLIFDELFKGTNVEDAYEASRRIISGFAGHRNNLFVLSSHLLELAPQLQDIKGVTFQHFESAVENGQPVFTYKMAKGVSTQRLGLLILKNEGVLEILEGNQVEADC